MKTLGRFFFQIQSARALELILLISIIFMLILILYLSIYPGDRASTDAFRLQYRFFTGSHA